MLIASARVRRSTCIAVATVLLAILAGALTAGPAAAWVDIRTATSDGYVAGESVPGRFIDWKQYGNRICVSSSFGCREYRTSQKRETWSVGPVSLELRSAFLPLSAAPYSTSTVVPGGETTSWGNLLWSTTLDLPAGQWNVLGRSTCQVTIENRYYRELRSSNFTWTYSYVYTGNEYQDCSGAGMRAVTKLGAPAQTGARTDEPSETAVVLRPTFQIHGFTTQYTVRGRPAGSTEWIPWGSGSVTATANDQTATPAVPVSGLTKATTYEWQIVASSAGGTLTGPVQQFTTAGPSDIVAPAVSLGGANGVVDTATPRVTFTSDEPARFTCAVDDGAFGSCDSGSLTQAGSFTPTPLGDGPHTIRIVATDALGNASAPVEVPLTVDTVAPEVTVSHSADRDGWSKGPSVDLEVVASDATTDLASVTCKDGDADLGPNVVSGEGVHEITCTAIDQAGHVTTATDTVRIDTTAPVVTVPEDLVREATGPDGATVDFAFSATDTRDGDVAASCDRVPGATYALGRTTVVCSASDAVGNAASKAFTIDVRDTEGPSLTLPEDLALDAGGPEGAVVTYSASAKDAVDGDVAPSCDPAAGTTLGLGSHTVTCTATDAAGNESSDTFDVAVRDVITLEQIADQTYGDTVTPVASAISGRPVDVTADGDCEVRDADVRTTGAGTCTVTASQGEDVAGRGEPAARSFAVARRALTITGDEQSRVYGDGNPDLTGVVGSALLDGDDVDAAWSTSATKASPVGTYATTAEIGGADASDYDITVKPGALEVTRRPLNVIAPDVSRPYGQPDAPFAGTIEGVVNDDDVTGRYSTAATAASKPGVYPIDADVIGADAVLANYDVGTTDGKLTVVDENKPALTVPSLVLAEATSVQGAVVNYAGQVSASDDADEDVDVTCTPESGTRFAIGDATVKCEAFDGTHTTTERFTVRVADTTAPAVTVPASTIAVDATSGEGAVVTYQSSATDAVDGSVVTKCAPASGTTFGFGTTAVSCTATDAAGNASPAQVFGVQVTMPSQAKLEATVSSAITSTAAYKALPANEQRKIIENLAKSMSKIAAARNSKQVSKSIADAQATVQTLVVPGGLTQKQADDLKGLVGRL